jgi:hypothetical protein
MITCYGHLDDAYREYPNKLSTLIHSRRPKRVVEIGGGANPSIPLRTVADLGISEYAILDISEVELSKAPDGYKKVVADICADQPIAGGYDFAFSRFLAEHVPNAVMFHRNIYRMLNPGGTAFHFFPTMFSSIYVLNIIIPERVGRAILTRLDSKRRQEGQAGKFRAYYRWCRGPVVRQVERFRRLGYEIEEYSGFFGYYYWDKFPLLGKLHRMKTKLLMKHPIPAFTSLAWLILKKPL